MKTRTAGNGKWLVFWCPGCDEAHQIPVDGSRGWAWNKDRENPTVSPSINVIGQCHSFVRDGRIEFLGDSKHKLAGQTVDLPDWPKPGWSGLDEG